MLNGTSDPRQPLIRHPKHTMSPSPPSNIADCAERQQHDGWNQGFEDRREEGQVSRTNPYTVPVTLQQSQDQQDQRSERNANSLHNPVSHSRQERIPVMLERHLRGAENHEHATQYQQWKSSSHGRSQSTIPSGSIDHIKGPKLATKLYDTASTQDLQNHRQWQIDSKQLASSLNALAPEFKSGSAVFSSGSSTAGTTMRPTAPAFTPTAASQQVPASRECSLSSSGLLFGLSNVEAASDSPGTGLADGKSKEIFSAVQYPLISKPVKKSKAVPIQRPKDERRIVGEDKEVQEGESGRITQSEGRQKRVRHSSRDVNQHPESSQEHSSPDAQLHTTNGLVAMLGGNHGHTRQNSISLEKAAQAADQLSKIIDDLSASEGSSSRDQPAETADAERREKAFPIDPDAMTPDTAGSRLPSERSLSVSSLPSERENVSDAQTPEDQPATCGSKPTQAPETAASDFAEDTTHLHETLADSDTLKSLHREELSPTLSTPHHSSFGASVDHLRAESQPISSLNQGNYSEPQTQEISEAIPDGVSYIEPSYEEINAVLKHIDGERPKAGPNGNDTSYRAGGADGISALDFHNEDQNAKDAMSSCSHDDVPNTSHSHGAPLAYQYLPQAGSESADSSIVKMIAENARFSPSYRPSYGDADPAALGHSDSADSAAISEWDKAFSSSNEARIRGRKGFFDARVNDVVGNVLQERLAPLERTLLAIQESVVTMSKQSSCQAERPRSSDNADTSDADDEEDVESNQSRAKSPVRLRNSDKLKALIAQITSVQQRSIPANELALITEDIKVLKRLFEETRPSFADVKTAVEEAIGKQLRGRSGPITSSHQSATAEKSQLQIAGLESMLKVADGRAEDEMKARRATEDALADSQRLLRIALQDAAEQRESAEETERSLSAFHEERHEALRRTAMLEGAQESFQSSVAKLSEKNAALEGTLEEYRLSSAQWRSEIESTKIENSDLRRTVTVLKNEMEDGISNRHALRAKFDQLQVEMGQASQNITRDQSMWRTKEAEVRAECRLHVADYERERQRSDKLENAVAALAENLRCDGEKHYQIATQYECDLHDQREVARLEKVRMQGTMDNDSAAATNKLSETRNHLERAVANVELQLERVSSIASTDREKYETSLQEAVVSKVAALKEHQTFHDQVVKGLREQHEQILHNAAQERQSLELHSNDRVALAEEKLLHHQDKIRHLEEKVEIAKSAAQAAVHTVQSKPPASGVSNLHGSTLSDGLPEKISPQALRESILVLQEQLQDRESQIEQLEQKLSAVDVDAPSKIKAQETEITWLRELLGVRIDDLEELITALAQPVYDREAIKDAAIRLKANLQMEQQEKERAHSGGQLSARLPSLSNLTSSPRAIPLAAATAWGNWRKGWNAPISDVSHARNRYIADTPSPSSPSTQSVVSGLLTPPNTNARRNFQSSAERGPRARLSQGKRSTASMKGQNIFSPGTRRPAGRASSPTTLSSTREASHDMDADMEEIRDNEGTQRGGWAEVGQEEPFYPSLVAFPGPV